MNLQKKATIISTITSTILMIMKLTVGILSGSIAIISSAIDSISDILVSIFNIFAVYTAEKEPDDIYNYWRWKIEALASFFEGFFILFSGLFVFYESIKKMVYQEQIEEVGLGIIVMWISVVVVIGLVAFLRYVYHKTGNIVIKSELLNYQTDLLTNVAVLVGLLFMQFSGFFLLDAILGLIIAVYIIFSAIKIIKQWYSLILDISLDPYEIVKIQKIILKSPKVTDFHELRTRESGGTKFVEAHLVFNNTISLFDAHEISHQIEDSIRALDTEKSWVILFHMEPYNDEHLDKNRKK